MKHYVVGSLALVTSLLIGCSTSGRYKMANDKAPLRQPTTLETVDAKPIHEPIYSWSIKPYTVRGKRYFPLKTAKNFKQQGKASWYGRKFHGHLTANGEVYDMFAMSAAHKTLPIPSFVKVTNLDNDKSIVVRVNDRGPFHGSRIIDLSYSAAHALDIVRTGTGNVSIEAIVVEKAVTYLPPEPINPQAVQPIEISTDKTKSNETIAPQSTQQQIFVQVIASSSADKINHAAQRLQDLLGQPTHTPQSNGIYRLRLGPLIDKAQAKDLISTLKNNGYPNAYMLYTKPSVAHN